MKQSLKSEITTILDSVPMVQNRARKKFVGAFVLGLIQSRNIQFCEVAQHLNDEVKLASNENRIQDFFREVELDYQLVAVLLLSLLPKKVKLSICIDRSEWERSGVLVWQDAGQYSDGFSGIWELANTSFLGIAG